jgi:hypothetical protein
MLFRQLAFSEHKQEQLRVQNVLRPALANLLFVGSPDCVPPDASGKFFAHF